MIEFACRCGTRLSADVEQSGTDMQCPECGLLLTVPHLQDLQSIATDGTYQLEKPADTLPGDFEEMHRAYTRDTVDLDGREIDLRYTAITPRRPPLEPGALPPEEPTAEPMPRPRYDPVTGELIRPMTMGPVRLPKHRMGLPPPIRRLRRGFEPLDAVRPATTFVRMFEPVNVVVISLFLLAHLVYFFGVVQMAMGFLFVVFLLLPVPMALLGHFGNVVVETGPGGQDELPRPLGDFSWYEDIWSPFLAIAFSASLCFGPAALSLVTIPNTAAAGGLALALTAVGLIVFPATFLTAVTSGSLANLRPDRVLGTAKAMAASYPALILGVSVGLGLYLLSILVLTLLTITVGILGGSILAGTVLATLPLGPVWLAALGGLFLGTLLAHWGCCCLGRAYRVYHRRFPWINQGAYSTEAPESGAFPVLAPRVQAPPSVHIPVARRANVPRP